jgi:hypothetical protein
LSFGGILPSLSINQVCPLILFLEMPCDARGAAQPYLSVLKLILGGDAGTSPLKTGFLEDK